MSSGADDVISFEEAAEILGVGDEQVRAMVDEGLLTTADAADAADGSGGFVRADVEAVRLQGG